MEIWRLRRLLRTHADGTDESDRQMAPGARPVLSADQPAIGTAPVRGTPGFVRPVEEDDLTAIAELHARVMPGSRQLPCGTLREQLSRLMLQHPWRNQY